jgi:type II secretory pathway component PulJ
MEPHHSKGQALIEVLISLTVLLSIGLVANRTLSTYQSSQKKMEKQYGSETKIKRVRTK